MTSRTTQTAFSLTALLLAGSALAVAQTAPPPPVGTAGENPIELSPFTVQAEEDEGYSSSLVTSGSRLRTDLKDVAASVTVLTDDFMNDLAANDIASALAFVSGAENDSTYHQESVAGLGGANQYVGGDFGDNNNRSGEVRVRGLGRATTTVNFIEVLGSTDRYNTERSEFLRGANSILFGLAEPAGLVNSSTKVANLRRDLNRVEIRLDDHGSMRGMVDFSRVLLRDKLAVRAVGVSSDTRYEVKTAHQRDKRLFLTGSYRPFRGTTFNAYAERVTARGRRPNFRTVQDNVSEWLTAYNTYAPQMTQAQINQAFFWDPVVNTNVAPASSFTLANGQTVNLGIIRRELNTNANSAVLIYEGNGQWTDPMDGVMTLLSNRLVTGATPAAASRSVFMRSGNSNQQSAGRVSENQVIDEGIFPFNTVEIGALPGNYRWEDVNRLYLNLDQRVTENLYFSAGFQLQEREQEQYFATLTQTNMIQLDINQRLPDGRVNPNFLRPFVHGRPLGEYNDTESRSLVLQANYDFDFATKTERFGWLGFHRFTSVFTDAKVDRLGYRWHYMIDNPSVFTGGALTDPTNAARWGQQLWYVGDPVQLGDTSIRYTGFPEGMSAQWNRSYDFLYYNSTVNPARWQVAPDGVNLGRELIAGGRNYTILKNRGLGLSLQSYFWDRRIITLVGWRRDQIESFQGVPLANRAFGTDSFGENRVAGLNRSQYAETGATFENEADTTTQSIVYRINNRLRVFANRSENFAATEPRQDNLYRNLPPENGETTDVGIGLTLMDGRLDVRATYFKSSQNSATSGTGVAGVRVVAFEEQVYNALQAAGRLSEYSVIDAFGNVSTEVYERPNNAATTEDRVSKGASIEISFRPNRNWDFVASVDKLDNKTTRVGRELYDFLDYRAPLYGKLFSEGMRVDGSSGSTVSSSNLLQTNFANTIAGNFVSELLREGVSNRGISDYTAKLVGRYKFNDGRLKGFTVGANLRWESGKVLGYGRVPTTFNFGGLQNYPGLINDLENEYRGKSVIAGGMFVSYGRRIFNNKVNWRVQLNAQELFSEQGLRVFAANGDGSPVYAIAPPRSFQLTNSFDF